MLVVSTCVLALSVAACGSSSSSTTPSATNAASTSPSGSQGVANAKAALQPFLTEPTSLGNLGTLPMTPPKKTVGVVACSEPTCSLLVGYLKDAADALGWKVDTVVATATDPGAAIDQLINSNVNYIAEIAYDVDTFRPQMAELQQKKIGLFEIAASDPVEGPQNGIYANIGGATAQAQWGEVESDWAIVDSNGHADVLDVNTPIYPVLLAQARGEQKALAANCPSCQYHALNVTVNDLTTDAVPGEIVSFLKSNPGINYLHFTAAQYETGVVSALKTAGLSNKIKIYGSAAQAEQFKEIADGTSAAWQIDPQPQAFWALVDQMARVATGAWSVAEADKAALIPWFLLTDKTRAAQFAKSTDPYPWPGPAGYESAYRTLWKVG